MEDETDGRKGRPTLRVPLVLAVTLLATGASVVSGTAGCGGDDDVPGPEIDAPIDASPPD